MPDPSASGTPATTAVAPGWYPDGSGGRRWWDGQAWTDHVAPAAAAGPLERPALPEGARIDTAWVWVVAVVTWVASVPAFFFDFSGYMHGIMTGQVSSALGSVIGYSVVTTVVGWGAYALSVVAAFRDYRHLQAIGVVRPFHWAFTFIGAIVYLIGRHVILRKVSRTAGWPLWVHVALYAVYTIAMLVWMSALMTTVLSQLPGYVGSSPYSFS